MRHDINYNVSTDNDSFGSDWQDIRAPTVSIDVSGGISQLDNKSLGVNASAFADNTPHPRRKDIQKYLRVILAVEILLQLVSNTIVKHMLENSYSEGIFLTWRTIGKRLSTYQPNTRDNKGIKKADGRGDRLKKCSFSSVCAKKLWPIVVQETCIGLKPSTAVNTNQSDRTCSLEWDESQSFHRGRRMQVFL